MSDQSRIQITTYSGDKQVLISNSGIEIKHEGKPVRVAASKKKSSRAGPIGYIFLLLDCSSSMAGTKLDKAKKGAVSFSKDALDKDYLVGLIKFETHAKLVVDPTNDLSIIECGLATLTAHGDTNLEEAMHISTNFLVGQTGQKIIVVVTDGMPNNHGDPQKSLKAGEFAKKQKIDIMAIGTNDADQDFLKLLASRSELGMKVTNEKFEHTIASSFKLLPSSF